MEMLATLPGWGAEGRWNEESICDVSLAMYLVEIHNLSQKK